MLSKTFRKLCDDSDMIAQRFTMIYSNKDVIPSTRRSERGEEDPLPNIQMEEVEDGVVWAHAELGDLHTVMRTAPCLKRDVREPAYLVGGDLLLPVPSLPSRVTQVQGGFVPGPV